MYRPPLEIRVLDGIRTVVTATALAAVFVISARTILTDTSSIGAQGVRLWIFATILLVAVRLSLMLSERRARRAGEAGHPTLIVGAGRGRSTDRLATARTS